MADRENRSKIFNYFECSGLRKDDSMRNLFIISLILLSFILIGCKSDNQQLINAGDQYGYLDEHSVIIWNEEDIEKVLYAIKMKDISKLEYLYEDNRVTILSANTTVTYHYSNNYPDMIAVTFYDNEHYNKQGFTFKNNLIKK